jgi:hypothetical protein
MVHRTQVISGVDLQDVITSAIVFAAKEDIHLNFMVLGLPCW